MRTRGARGAGTLSGVGGPLICVIEDEEAIAAAVAARLRAEGFAGQVAADGPAGFALCERLLLDSGASAPRRPQAALSAFS